MTIKPSGTPLAFTEIEAEFGQASPRSLSQYYRGGGRVPDIPANAAIATSGAITIGSFYGAINRIQINITISANTNNYVLNTAKAPGYVAGISDITLTINSGVVIGSSSTGAYAFDVDTSWNALDTVKIINNGMIVGAGGRGSGYNGASSSGGTALRVQRQSAVTNNSIIGGGGGGGGKGVGGSSFIGDTCFSIAGYSGGGGGAGSQAGLGALGENVQWADCSIKTNGLNGDNGTTTTGGAGKKSPYWNTGYGDSGNGGALGSSGQRGGVYAPGDYGAAGACTSGNANITWLATGTRYGALN